MPAPIPPTEEPALGPYLRRVREARHMSLRAVEAATGRAVTNGYLSQIESGTARQPSPNVLHHLASVYDLSYRDLLVRAGHHVPVDDSVAAEPMLNGVPLRALNLTEQEQRELMTYLDFLRTRGAQ